MKHKQYVEARAKGLCPYCKIPLPEGVKICPDCAAKVSETNHINYIRRKYGITHEEAVRIFKEGTEEQRPNRKLVKKKDEFSPPPPQYTISEINEIANSTSEQENHYVSYGEIVARQSGAYDWKIRRGK